MRDIVRRGRVLEGLKPIEYFARNANNARKKLRPEEPTNIEFVLEESCLPEDFLIGDLRNDGARHLIFATPNQLSLLEKAKTWYVDATFKVVKDPFHQLFSVHAFVRSEKQ